MPRTSLTPQRSETTSHDCPQWMNRWRGGPGSQRGAPTGAHLLRAAGDVDADALRRWEDGALAPWTSTRPSPGTSPGSWGSTLLSRSWSTRACARSSRTARSRTCASTSRTATAGGTARSRTSTQSGWRELRHAREVLRQRPAARAFRAHAGRLPDKPAEAVRRAARRLVLTFPKVVDAAQVEVFVDLRGALEHQLGLARARCGSRARSRRRSPPWTRRGGSRCRASSRPVPAGHRAALRHLRLHRRLRADRGEPASGAPGL